MIKNLGRRQKKCFFLESQENIKCTLPDSVLAKCDEFIRDFNMNTLQEKDMRKSL